MDARALIEAEAHERGFLTAWAPVDLPEVARSRYRSWLAEGNQAGMSYLETRLEDRLEPTRRFGWARSVLVLAASHAYPDPGIPGGGVRIGRVARYAWVRDYHGLVRPHLEALEALAGHLGLEAKGYVDHGPLSERSYGVLGGLGWIGKNAMLLRMGETGSYLTLAVLLTSLPLEDSPKERYPNRCGRCMRCFTACPTNALPGDGTLDARRCISYWTIEHRGLIPPELWLGMGDWILGCDICQQVCPWNRKAREFWRGFAPEPQLAHPDIRDFFVLSSHALARKYADTVFLRPGRTRLARNALIVLANARDEQYLPLVRRAGQDVNPLVRATAAHALVRLGDPGSAEKLLADPDPQVTQQARAALAQA
ncbi:MAG TPA: tRNA epoxyqueuosine(34) reductase QueG [Meiothermus sp.]|nr:tRNA epoxyqueuosine(34) reductase QueG [Meiothermus sp.]